MASGERFAVSETEKVEGRLERGRLARLDAELQACTSLQEREVPTDKCSWRGGGGAG